AFLSSRISFDKVPIYCPQHRVFPVLPIKRTGISRSCGTTKIIEKQKCDVKAFFHFLKHPGVRIRKTRKKVQKKLTPEDVSKVSIVSSC
ncbi:MAG: hypothetical protein SOW65_05270, partial [Candidatus Enterosoma sp.]|nr:hypothetical protein [bacterium]MDY3211231.1 hypothetical protein [Candidatus Enterosoma sp.]